MDCDSDRQHIAVGVKFLEILLVRTPYRLEDSGIGPFFFVVCFAFRSTRVPIYAPTIHIKIGQSNILLIANVVRKKNHTPHKEGM